MNILKAFSASCFLLCLLVQEAQADFFKNADSFFSNYVENGLVDYQAIKSDGKALEALLEEIALYDLNGVSKNEKIAFYINAYNILVISGVQKHYPIKSPLDVKGFFDQQKYLLAGSEITLNDIENKKLRDIYKDSRIHFVLVCGALSCPSLISEAYTPLNVEQKMEERTIASINKEDFIRVNDSQKKVEISEIFKWYATDFGGQENYRSYLNTYRKTKIPDSYEIGFYTYDWSLNEKK